LILVGLIEAKNNSLRIINQQWLSKSWLNWKTNY